MFDSLCGHYLIAGCRLRDPNFFKTVVLLVEHNDEGAMGLVINRPSSITVSNALAGHFDLPDNGDLVYCGGPVVPGDLFVLHNMSEMEPNDSSIADGLYVGCSGDTFERVISAVVQQQSVDYRVYSGCAGWGPGQLEGELARGDWFTLPASAEFAFHQDPYCVWDEVLKQFHQAKRILPHSTPNPEAN